MYSAASRAASGVLSRSGLSAPADRGLFDHEPGVAAVQGIKCRAHQDSLVDNAAQVGACTLLAVTQNQNRILEAAFDQIILKGGVVLEILLGLTGASPCRAAAGAI